MKGGIYSDEKCPLCGGRFKDDGRRGLFCPNHPEQRASRRFRIYFRGVTRRFRSYEAAQKCLTGLRFKEDEGTFDPREYRADNPLGFENLANEWLRLREAEIRPDGISPNTYRALEDHIWKAIRVFGPVSVKRLRLKDFQFFLTQYNVSNKSKFNYIQTLKQFFKWLYDNDEISVMPKFPKVQFELRRRKTVTKADQFGILDTLKGWAPYKTWLGIKWMTTYFNVRPEEWRNIREGDINLKAREILIRHPKENRSKIVYLIDEDVEILGALPPCIDPDAYFFRHKNGRQFGEKHFYKWWKRACAKLGIQGVDLYGGTTHSTTRALRKYRTPEEIRYGSMRSTTKAFDRYYWEEGDDLRAIYSDARGGKKVAKKFRHSESDN